MTTTPAEPGPHAPAGAALHLPDLFRRPARLLDVESAHLIRAGDLELARRDGAWVVTGVDSRRRRRVLPSRGTKPAFREWGQFEPLIGLSGTVLLRGPFGRIRRLKPAQIADLLEDASKDEETEILGLVHADPELEADVFEELEARRAPRRTRVTAPRDPEPGNNAR